jgi:hypothetical protein
MPTNLHQSSTATIHISKLDAARQQLETAVQLWFHDSDPISVHTLAFAAYDVIHAISKKRNPKRRDLLFDSRLVKEEFRSEWSVLIKTPSGFFKHARNDPEGTIDFKPALSELLIMFAIVGLATCKIDPTPAQYAFLLHRAFTGSAFFTEEGRKLYLDRLSVKDLEDIRSLPKRVFLQAYLQGRYTPNQP